MRDAMPAHTSQLRKGVLELAILAILGGGETYGAALISDLAQIPGLAATAGTVYPLLARLEKAGYVVARWHPLEHGAPRKYYSLTAEGGSHLRAQARAWAQLHVSVNTLLQGVL